MYCLKCKKEKHNEYFYNGVIGICKNCLIKELDNNKNIFTGLFDICREYNIYFDYNLIYELLNYKKLVKKDMLLNEYLKNIKSLPQYKCLYFKHSFEKKNKTDKKLYLSNEEFIDYDIEGIKKNILKSLENGDTNSHGKWLNSLREALELKDKLKNKNNENINNTINVTTNINKDDINRIIDTIIKTNSVHVIK